MTKVAVLDDWQGVARSSADWSPLLARAEVVFFARALDEDDAAVKLADFEIVLSTRERAVAGLGDQPAAEADVCHIDDPYEMRHLQKNSLAGS